MDDNRGYDANWYGQGQGPYPPAPYPPTPYQQPGAYPPAGPPVGPGWSPQQPPQPQSVGGSALTCAIVSLVILPWILAVIALVRASRDARLLRVSPVPIPGAGKITAARIVASVSLVIHVIIIPVIAIALLVSYAADDSPAGGPSRVAVDAFDEVEKGGVGTCFNDANKPKVVDCAGPHQGEFVGGGKLEGDLYPGEAKVIEESEALCAPLVTGYLGDRPSGKTLDALNTWYVYPTQTSWTLGDDRKVFCTVTAKGEGGTLTGSHRAKG